MKYFLFQDFVSNETVYFYKKKLTQQDLFNHVLNYRFNILLLIKIVEYNFSDKSHDIIEEIMFMGKNLCFYNLKNYYMKYSFRCYKDKFQSNEDNFRYWVGKSKKKALYYLKKLKDEEIGNIMEEIPDRIKKLEPFLKDKIDMLIIYIIVGDFSYSKPKQYCMSMSLQERKLLFCNSIVYNKLVYIKCLKYSFLKSCFDSDYKFNFMFYYNKLIEIDQIITNTLLLNLVITYKFDMKCKVINTLRKYDLMYTFRGKREKQRINFVNNLTNWIFLSENNYIYSNKKSSKKNNTKIVSFLKDFGIKNKKIAYYNRCVFESDKVFRLKEDKKYKLLDELFFDKKEYKRLKEKLSNE